MAKSQLQRLLWLQGNNCFYCGCTLKPADASIDHVIPKSLGGKDTVENKVVCCKTINHHFADMPLKEKLASLLQWKGQIPCPNKSGN
ncbi:HNH endonuclease [Endozoicomonas acroporae]|uniref:HNH endonuclease n=1 Tax=Endozoicomonas acroporae TaxID=1701104 RepID=UPI000C764085|nr:HNH endonuclease [Endozoicomonas acroporae]